MKTTKLIGRAWILAVIVVLGLGVANAGGQRDVIDDATTNCGGVNGGSPQVLQDSCDLLSDTNGEQITGDGCTTSFDGVDTGIVDYLLRNCDKNEEALLRKAASAVLSLSAFLQTGKQKKQDDSVGYLCEYADRFMTLYGAGKLVYSQDLAADAENIAVAIKDDPSFVACP